MEFLPKEAKSDREWNEFDLTDKVREGPAWLKFVLWYMINTRDKDGDKKEADADILRQMREMKEPVEYVCCVDFPCCLAFAFCWCVCNVSFSSVTVYGGGTETFDWYQLECLAIW